MIKLKNLLSIFPVFVLACSSIMSQQQTGAKVDVKRLGPQVGERVPDFQLPDQNGKTWSLGSIMGPNGAMLVFYRSADW